MSTEGIELAHYILEREKDGRKFIYEMKLYEFAATKEYQFLRRWYYSDSKKPLWRHKGWNKDEQKQFNHKLVQKRDIFHYSVIKQVDKRS
jgi:hypothetical protein